MLANVTGGALCQIHRNYDQTWVSHHRPLGTKFHANPAVINIDI